MASGNTSAPAHDARADAAIVAAKVFGEVIGRVLDQGSFTLHVTLDRWLAWLADEEERNLPLWSALRVLAGYDLADCYPAAPESVGSVVTALITIAAALDEVVCAFDNADDPDELNRLVTEIASATGDLEQAVAALQGDASAVSK